jgi:serine/threonine protein phosphatase PrpC
MVRRNFPLQKWRRNDPVCSIDGARALMAWQPLSPSRLHHFHFGTAFGMADVGLVRTSNEDNFLIDEQLGLAMVTDGMGGHEAGEIASAYALTALGQYLQRQRARTPASPVQMEDTRTNVLGGMRLWAQDPDATWADETVPAIGMVLDAIELVNDHLYARNIALDHADGGGMGTTLTGMWQPWPNGPLSVFQVGDSRLYRCRQGQLALLTRDQTLYQQAIDAGLIEGLPKRNLLLQAIGPASAIKPDVKTVAMEPGDLFMLCSDGLHGSVTHAEIEAVMAAARASGIEHACKQFIALAKADGGRDNITVVLVAAD